MDWLQQGAVMSQPKLITCHLHGPSLYCYVQRDGSHLDESACECQGSIYKPHCPVDLHREAANKTPRSNDDGRD